MGMIDGNCYQFRADEEVTVVREECDVWEVLKVQASGVMVFDYIDAGDGELEMVEAVRRFEA